MKKKILLGIIIIAAVVLAIYGGLLIKRQIDIKNENNEIKKDSKVLFSYFSAQGHTDYVAKEIAKNLSADLFLIEPKEEMVEIVTQLGFYCSWASSWNVFPMIEEVYEDK